MGSGASKDKKRVGKENKNGNKDTKPRTKHDTKRDSDPKHEDDDLPPLAAREPDNTFAVRKQTQPHEAADSDAENPVDSDVTDTDVGATDSINLNLKPENAAKRPTSAAGNKLDFLPKEKFAERLETYCGYIFSKADVDGDGRLNQDEFTSIVQSKTLGLSITAQETREMMIKYDTRNGGDAIETPDFVYVMVDLMQKHAKMLKAKNDKAWEWFVMYFDDDPNSLPLYYSTDKRKMTYDKPVGISYRVEFDDQQEFQTLIHVSEDTTLSSFVDKNGIRFYLDPDSQQWVQFPDSWVDSFEVVSERAFEFNTETNYAKVEDNRYIRFVHPVTGQEFESQIENDKRMLYDEKSGDWIRCPVCVEKYIPEVIRGLYQLRKQLPAWTNITEKILALRDNNYNAQEAVAWKITETEYAEEFEEPSNTNHDPSAGPTLAASEEKLQELKEVQAELETVKKSLQKSMADSLTSKSERMQAVIEEEAAREMLASVTQTMKKMQTDRNERDRAYMELELENQELKAKIELSKRNNLAVDSGMTLRNEQLQTRVAELTQQLESIAGNDSTLEKSLASRETALTEAQEKIAQMSMQLNEQANKLEEAEAQNSRLRTEVRDLQAECSQLKTETEMKSGNIAVNQQTQKTALKKMQVQIDTLKVQKEELKDLVRSDLVPSFRISLQGLGNHLTSSMNSIAEKATREILAKYRYEVRQRKLLYNKIQELKGNIRVFCRVRADDRVSCILKFPDERALGTPIEIICPNPRDPTESKKYEFDRVFSPNATQADVFDDTEPIMTSAVDGYNVTLIAYGQTGSGKTYTMMGTEDNPGVNRRAVNELLRVCHERDSISYVIKVSLMEIYNEKFVDLLCNLPVEQQECELRMDQKTKAGYVTNLTERVISSTEDVVQTLADGERNRSVASTKMNSVSSRSHLLLTLTIEGKDSISGQVTKGKLTMVDLAGSERISKTEATGQRLVEAAAINKSLSALGQVFASLKKKDSHIPYRNSKLTHILQDSLGGDAKACVFINVSPAESNLAETVGTINFGSAIRSIELGGAKKTSKKK
eukprot:m.80093 g.80093  ORF g.80093 m.80093 type:complete len:1053 (+) comp12740_c0_seq2:592-3750(+)